MHDKLDRQYKTCAQQRDRFKEMYFRMKQSTQQLYQRIEPQNTSEQLINRS